MMPSVRLWSVAFSGHNHMLYEAFPLLQQHLGLAWTVHSCADPESFVRGGRGGANSTTIFFLILDLLIKRQIATYECSKQQFHLALNVELGGMDNVRSQL